MVIVPFDAVSFGRSSTSWISDSRWRALPSENSVRVAITGFTYLVGSGVGSCSLPCRSAFSGTLHLRHQLPARIASKPGGGRRDVPVDAHRRPLLDERRVGGFACLLGRCVALDRSGGEPIESRVSTMIALKGRMSIHIGTVGL